jgi:hypothetical protein
MTAITKLRSRLRKLEALAADQPGTPEGELAASFARQTREKIVAQSERSPLEAAAEVWFREHVASEFYDFDLGGDRRRWTGATVDRWTQSFDLGGVKVDFGPEERIDERTTRRKFKIR